MTGSGPVGIGREECEKQQADSLERNVCGKHGAPGLFPPRLIQEGQLMLQELRASGPSSTSSS